jgi:hypothetical protein
MLSALPLEEVTSEKIFNYGERADANNTARSSRPLTRFFVTRAHLRMSFLPRARIQKRGVKKCGSIFELQTGNCASAFFNTLHNVNHEKHTRRAETLGCWAKNNNSTTLDKICTFRVNERRPLHI